MYKNYQRNSFAGTDVCCVNFCDSVPVALSYYPSYCCSCPVCAQRTEVKKRTLSMPPRMKSQPEIPLTKTSSKPKRKSSKTKRGSHAVASKSAIGATNLFPKPSNQSVHLICSGSLSQVKTAARKDDKHAAAKQRGESVSKARNSINQPQRDHHERCTATSCSLRCQNLKPINRSHGQENFCKKNLDLQIGHAPNRLCQCGKDKCSAHGSRADPNTYVGNQYGAQPWKTYCVCCNKNPYDKRHKEVNGYKHIFPPSKSCPRLDAIDEEGPEYERKHQDLKARGKEQKSLEDSCADFLNIICDNIMESVQKSVDCKLKEFNCQAATKYECLYKKLENNEEAMKTLCCKVLDKMTEQNKTNFKDICNLLKNMMATNNNRGKEKSTVEKECQWECPKVIEIVSCKNTTDVVEQGAVSKAPDKVESAKKHKLFRCNFCHFFPNSGEKFHPAGVRNNIKEDCNEFRGTGGCSEGEDCTSSQQNVENVEIFQKPSTPCNPTTPNIVSAKEIKPNIDHNTPMPRTFTTFSLTPPGKTIFNCSCFTEGHDGGSGRTKCCSYHAPNSDKNHGSVISQNIYDNYDTSGYATDPEDDNEKLVSNSGRKKLQKKSSRLHCNQQISGSTNSDAVNTDSRLDLSSERSNSPSGILNKNRANISNTSPTRLPRL